MALVTKGDVIQFSDMVRSATDKTVDPVRITITWQQNLRTRSEAYISCTYSVISSGKRGQLFIQASKLGDLWDKRDQKGDKNWITVQVGDAFQYGQNEDRTDRFLVYHDKSNRPYQRRFVKQLTELLGDRALDWAQRMGFNSLNDLKNDIESLFGEYLRDF
ncbi:hypothetical protein FGRMN_1839 [Fusarium graminum]|nr:hypothetical protein FGRMN_1839 [Fusarium graminum]